MPLLQIGHLGTIYISITDLRVSKRQGFSGLGRLLKGS